MKALAKLQELTKFDEGVLVVDRLDAALVVLASSTAKLVLQINLKEISDLGQKGKCKLLWVLSLSETEVDNASLDDVTKG